MSCKIFFRYVTTIDVGWYSQEYLLRLDLLGSVRHATVEHMPPPTLHALAQMLTKGISSLICLIIVNCNTLSTVCK